MISNLNTKIKRIWERDKIPIIRPLGFFIPLLNYKNFSLRHIFVISLLTSVGIEIIQVIVMILTMTSNRCFDVDDIIANTFLTLPNSMKFLFR